MPETATSSAPRTLTPRLALALSGGGFRASLFHLGVIRRLAEEGWLGRVDVLSMVSGGSLLGAFAVPRWRRMLDAAATKGEVAALEETITRPFVAAIGARSFLAWWGEHLLTLPFRKVRDASLTRTSVAAELYGEWLAEKMLCSEMPEAPYAIFNASSLIAGRAWRFTRDGLGDSRFGYSAWGAKALPVGVAAGASAAFPPVFTPARIRTADYSFGGSLYGEASLDVPKFIPLSDGGVYDNLGMEVFSKEEPERLPGGVRMARPEFLVASDAGYPAQTNFRDNGLPAISEGLLLYRVDAMARDQVGALRRRMAVRQFIEGKPHGVIATLGSSIASIERGAKKKYVRSADPSTMIPESVLPRIQQMRTNLDRFTAMEADAVQYHAYLLTDAVLTLNNDSQPDAYRVKSEGKWVVSKDQLQAWNALLKKV
jgi:NTE family protein